MILLTTKAKEFYLGYLAATLQFDSYKNEIKYSLLNNYN